MPVLPWLWLNEAAHLVADRLAAAQREEDPKAAMILAEAQSQILDRAHREALIIEGKSWRVEPDPPGRPVPEEWRKLEASYWWTGYHITENNPHGKIKLDWKSNSIEFDTNEDFDCGYGNLRVSVEQIDRLWPVIVHSPTLRGDVPQPEQTPIDGPDQLYNTGWFQLMQRAIAEHNITSDNQPKAEILREWFQQQVVEGVKVSQNQAKMMATFVRRPDQMRGGLKPYARRAAKPDK